MCNVVPISAVQQSDPVIHIDTHSFCHIIFHHVLSQEIRYGSLCYTEIPITFFFFFPVVKAEESL